MKKYAKFFLLLSLILPLLPAAVFAEISDTAVQSLTAASNEPADLKIADSTGTIKGLKGRYTLTPEADVSVSVLSFIDDHKAAFGLAAPKSELKLLTKKTTKEGNTHLRFQQTVNGIPVVGRQILAKVDKDGKLANITADYIATPEVGTTPAISSDDAVKAANAALTASGKAGKQWMRPKASLAVLSTMGVNKLAYLVELQVATPPGRWFYFVDAADGKVLRGYNAIRNDAPYVGEGQLWDLTWAYMWLWNITSTNYSYLVDDNTMANGNVQPSDFSYDGSLWQTDSNGNLINPFLTNHSISAWDDNHSGYGSDFLMAEPANPSFIYNTDTDTLGNSITPGVDIVTYQANVSNYWYNNFNRWSWDGKGGSLVGVAHYDTSYDNAFWNGYFMTYGDGDGTYFTDFTQGLDVIAHEIGHGVTQAMVPPYSLNYVSQTGAMDEHISDTWGVMVKGIYGSGNYLMGDDILGPTATSGGYTSLRDYWTPTDQHAMTPCPDNMANFLYTIDDAGGVHTNMGILSNAASWMIYLFGNDMGDSYPYPLGRDFVAQLYYGAYNYLTPDAHFYDLREAMANEVWDVYWYDPIYANYVVGRIYESFQKAGVGAPKASEVVQYDRATVTSPGWGPGTTWPGYDNNNPPNHVNYQIAGCGTYFEPYYPGKLTGVNAVFKQTSSSVFDNIVWVEVVDPYNGLLTYKGSYPVALFGAVVTIPLPNIPFEDGFYIFLYPDSSSVAVASDDGGLTNMNYTPAMDPWGGLDNYNVYGTSPKDWDANFAVATLNGESYMLRTNQFNQWNNLRIADYNFRIRPKVTYNTPAAGQSTMTLDVSQSGANITAKSYVFINGAARSAATVSIYYSAYNSSTGTWGAWTLKTSVLTSASGLASATFTMPAGTYGFRSVCTVGTIKLMSPDPKVTIAAVSLASPVNGAITGTSPTLAWKAYTFTGAAGKYHLEVATAPTFGSSKVINTDVTGTSYTPSSALAYGRTYFWRVISYLDNGMSMYSAARSFTAK